MTHIISHQITLPKGVRDRMTFADEALVYELIDFAYNLGRDKGYDEGYADAQFDANEAQ